MHHYSTSDDVTDCHLVSIASFPSFFFQSESNIADSALGKISLKVGLFETEIKIINKVCDLSSKQGNRRHNASPPV